MKFAPSRRREALPACSVLLAFVLVLALAVPALADITLELAGTYKTGVFDDGASEIVDYDKDSKRVFVINAHDRAVDIIDVSDITNPKKYGAIDLKPYGKAANSVAVSQGLVAVAVEAKPKQNPGKVVFFDTDGKYLADFPAGALPDMVTFTPDGKFVLVANEGEPNDDYSNDPEGSVTLVDLRNGLTAAVVKQLDFKAFNDKKDELIKKTYLRVSGPGATLAMDVEPEYIAVSPDSTMAYVSLQENNGMATVDILKGEIVKVTGLGYKDWGNVGWKFDATDKDQKIDMRVWPAYGVYMPDTIAAYTDISGEVLVATANEGDSREYGDYADEERLRELTLDPAVFSEQQQKELTDRNGFGRIKVVTDLSDANRDGLVEKIFVFGGRSFSLRSVKGNVVFDSGDDFETIIAERYPDNFNATSDKNDKDNRSDDKGPEPEGLDVGIAFGKTYAFIGMERMGGIMIYDVTDYTQVKFVDYVLNRDFSKEPESGEAGDLAPEGIKFVEAEKSHTGEPLLIVGNEVSGTTSIYVVKKK